MLAISFELNDASIHEHFEAYAAPIVQRNEWIQALEWVPKVAPSQFEYTQVLGRSIHGNSFQITQLDANTHTLIPVESPQSRFLYPVFLVEPKQGNEKAIGFDLGSNHERLETLEEAAELGKPAATVRISLVQINDKTKNAGFLMFQPVYNQLTSDVHGFVLGVYNIGNMLEVFEQVEEMNEFLMDEGGGVFLSSGITMNVVDVSNGTRTFLNRHRIGTINSSDGSPGPTVDAAEFQISERIMIANRIWEISFIAEQEFMTLFMDESPLWLAVFGAMATTLSLLGIGTLYRKQRNAQIETLSALQMSAAELSPLVQAIPDPLVTFNADNRVHMCNASAAFALGCTKEQLLHTEFEDIFLDFEDGLKNARNETEDEMNDVALRHNVIVKTLNVHVRRNPLSQGSKSSSYLTSSSTRRDVFPSELSFSFVKDQGSRICVFRDRTYNLMREDVLKAASKAAEEANQAKSDFLSYICHELRNPLHAISGVVSMTSRTNLTTSQLDMVKAIKRLTDFMTQIVSDVLDLSKLQSGKVELEMIEFDLHQVLSDLDSAHSAIAKERGLDWSVDVGQGVPSKVIGDPTRIRQCISNLVTNAEKFCQKGFIRVQANLIETWSDCNKVKLQFSVEDSGIGIAASVLPKIGEAFQQANRTIGREFGGSGLGLSIVKMLVQQMRGCLSIKSEEGVGSTFQFTAEFKVPPKTSPPSKMISMISVFGNALSRSAASSSWSAGSEESESDLLQLFNSHFEQAHEASPRPVRVLLVEDNVINQKIVQHFLEMAASGGVLRHGFELQIANNGLEGLDVVLLTLKSIKTTSTAALGLNALPDNADRSTETGCRDDGNDEITAKPPFDVILLDITMPVMDGFTACTKMLQSGCATPILALTANELDATEDME